MEIGLEHKFIWLESSITFSFLEIITINANNIPYKVLKNKIYIVKWPIRNKTKFNFSKISFKFSNLLKSTHVYRSIFHLDHHSVISSSWVTNKAFHGRVTKTFSKNIWKAISYQIIIQKLSVEIWEFFCHSDFTWNQRDVAMQTDTYKKV